MNYSLAMAVGHTAADIQMRKAGREIWNEDDYNRAAEVFWKCYGNDALAQSRQPDAAQ